VGTFRLEIAPGIAEQYDQSILRSSFTYLARIFGDQFARIVPSIIYDVPTLDRLLDTATYLRKLQGCSGFREHADQYLNDASAAFFVTQLAGLLVSKVQKLVLEPPVPGGFGKSDVMAVVDDAELFLECKNPQRRRDEALEAEHLEIARLLLPRIPLGCQIDVTYRASKPVEWWMPVSDSVQKLCCRAVGNGVLIDNDDLTVELMRECVAIPPQPTEMEFILGGSSEDMHSRSVVPMHVLCSDGRTVGIHGPKVEDFRVTIERCIEEAREQCPVGCAFAVIIGSGSMMGSLNDNIRVIRTRFQPDRNTRIGAVLLLNTLGDKALVNAVLNPYARIPLSRGTVQLLTKLDGEQVRRLRNQWC